MRGVSRSGSFVKLSNSLAKAGPMSAAIALGLTCVPRLELNGPALRHFEPQPDSLRINQRLLDIIDEYQKIIAVHYTYRHYLN